jgi:hypothetical protein
VTVLQQYLGQGWPTSILSRAKNENFQILRAAHKFVALKVKGNLIYIKRQSRYTPWRRLGGEEV